MPSHEFKIMPSLFYSIFLGVTLLASMVVMALLPWSLWLKLVGMLVVGVYGAAIFWRYALLRAQLSVTGIAQLEHGQWQVTTAGGDVNAVLRGDSTVTSIISVLRFDFPGLRRPVSCIICRDSLRADSYRRLLGVVRMGA